MTELQLSFLDGNWDDNWGDEPPDFDESYPTASPHATCSLVVLGDLQIPHQDVETLDAVFSFLADFQPNVLVLNGDIADFTALSRFRLTAEQRSQLGYEKLQLNNLLAGLRNILSETQIYYIMGNHEARLENYIVDHAPELEGALSKVLSFEQFACLPILGIELISPYGAGLDWHGLFITHGTVIREHTAKHNLITEGSSGISNHTHRLSSYYKTDRSGEHAWYENGCLCRLDATPPATPGVRNWQQGFTVAWARLEDEAEVAGEHHQEALWTVVQIPIIGHQFVWQGKVYGSS